MFVIGYSLFETNNSRLQNRTSPPFLKEVAEARSRRIREINPPESPFRQGGRALMRPKKGVGIFRPFRALGETHVILSIGRCPMLLALSPLGSKIGEFISIIVWCPAVVVANLRIYKFTFAGNQSPLIPLRQGGRALMSLKKA